MNIDVQSVPVQITIKENDRALAPTDEGVDWVRIALSPEHQLSGALGGGSPVVRDGSSFKTNVVPGTYDIAYLRSLNGQQLRWTVKNGLPLMGPVSSTTD